MLCLAGLHVFGRKKLKQNKKRWQNKNVKKRKKRDKNEKRKNVFFTSMTCRPYNTDPESVEESGLPVATKM